MISKEYTPSTSDVEQLKELLQRPKLAEATKKSIQQQILNIQAGQRGEKETAYHLDFGLAKTPNTIVIHDLRIDVDGRIAQIDHLVISRLMIAYVVESKNFSGGLSINDHGEFVTFWNGRPRSMPSPIMQNKRHIDVLKEAGYSGVFQLPKRFGLKLPLKFKSVISVGTGTTIKRPKKKVEGMNAIAKSDTVPDYIKKDIENTSNLDLIKVISTESLLKLGESISAAHTPKVFDWHARFGIEPTDDTEVPAEPETKAKSRKKTPKAADKKKKDPKVCAVCGEELDPKVVWFCNRSKARFNGKLLCREHQSTGTK